MVKNALNSKRKRKICLQEQKRYTHMHTYVYTYTYGKKNLYTKFMQFDPRALLHEYTKYYSKWGKHGEI